MGSDGAGVRRKTAGPGEVATKIREAGEVRSGVDVNGSEVAVKEKVGLKGGKAVAGTEDKNVVGGGGFGEGVGGLGGSGVWGRLRGLLLPASSEPVFQRLHHERRIFL